MHAGYPLSFSPHHDGPEVPDETAYVFAFRRRELLVGSDHSLPTIVDAAALGIQTVRTQYLGRLGATHCYSAEVEADFLPPSGMIFRDLRQLFGALAEELHAVAGRAVQIVEWDRTHQYCGACASETLVSATDRSRKCPHCGLVMYPRLAPAMIVAVEKDDEILLARSGHFPAGIYSVLAGFIEPGESAEEAVVREVWEETRIVVDDVRYFCSQPWPFPNSLMLGFTARYRSGEIDTSYDTEVEDAGWFAADALPKTFPGQRSISQWLLRDFVARQGG